MSTRRKPLFVASRLFAAIAVLSACALGELPHLPDTWQGSLFSRPDQRPSSPYGYLVASMPASELLPVVSALEIGNSIPIITASLVTSNKPQTLESVGFLIDFTSDQVIGTSGHRTHFDWQDTAGWNSKSQRFQAAVEAYSKKYPIRPPWRLEEETPSTSYNEIAVRGLSPQGEPVKITGVYLWVDKNGKLLPSTQREYGPFEKFLKEHSLPVVKFYSPHALFADEPLTVIRDPQTHVLSGFSLQRFSQRYEVDLTDPESDTDFAFSRSIFQNRLERVPLTVTDHSDVVLDQIRRSLARQPTLAREMAALKAQFQQEDRCSAICDWFFSQVMPKPRAVAGH